jgi:hypothetical protein
MGKIVLSFIVQSNSILSHYSAIQLRYSMVLYETLECSVVRSNKPLNSTIQCSVYVAIQCAYYSSVCTVQCGVYVTVQCVRYSTVRTLQYEPVTSCQQGFGSRSLAQVALRNTKNEQNENENSEHKKLKRSSKKAKVKKLKNYWEK